MVNMCGLFGCDIFAHILEETNRMSVFKGGWLYVFIAIIKGAGILSSSSLHINTICSSISCEERKDGCSIIAFEVFEHKPPK